MSKVAIFEDLRSLLLKELGVAPPENVQTRALTEAVREFFSESRCWYEWLAPIASVDYQQEYVLPNLFTNSSIHSIRNLKVGGEEIDRARYDLSGEIFVRFNSGYEPVGLTNQVLECANAGSDDVTDWNAVLDASVTVTADAAYNVTIGSFADADTMEDVARIIQTKVRQAMASPRFSVVWDGLAFSMSVNAGTISYLSAPTSGTDISGVAWCAGMTGQGTLGGRIEAEVVLRPDYQATDAPDWLLDRWSLGIVSLAAFRLKTEPKKPWSDVTTAVLNQSTYLNQKFLAIRSTIGGLNDRAFSFSA